MRRRRRDWTVEAAHFASETFVVHAPHAVDEIQRQRLYRPFRSGATLTLHRLCPGRLRFIANRVEAAGACGSLWGRHLRKIWRCARSSTRPPRSRIDCACCARPTKRQLDGTRREARVHNFSRRREHHADEKHTKSHPDYATGGARDVPLPGEFGCTTCYPGTRVERHLHTPTSICSERASNSSQHQQQRDVRAACKCGRNPGLPS